MIPRHKVFISYHHAGDQLARDTFINTFCKAAAAFVDRSVGFGAIDDTGLKTDRVAQIIRDEFIRDATVTVVLIGRQTWQRKHVDWEIDSSLRDTARNLRCGLLGILLPSYWPGPAPWGEKSATEPARSSYWRYTIPPRLWDNVEVGYARIRPWPTSPLELQGWIHEAFQRRQQMPPPTLRRSRFGNNRSEMDVRWWP